MRTRTRAATIAILAALLAGTTAACGQSYEDKADACIAAVKERAEGETGKPEACEGINDDDYTAIVVGQAAEDLGWTDENGRFDKNKMIEDSLNDSVDDPFEDTP